MITKKSGFTLVELLMVMGIMGLLMVILFQVFGAILDMKLRSEATTAVAQDSRYLISRLTYDISRSSDITLPLAGGSGNTLILVIDGVDYVYELNGTTLKLSVGGGASQALTGIGTKITSIVFTHFADIGNKKSVQIVLNIAPTTIQQGGTPGERTLTTTVVTR
jgi:prepilin-type N-terminal cleavage/methylation domain-containing protein